MAIGKILAIGLAIIPINVFAEPNSQHSANEFIGAKRQGAVGDMGNFYFQPAGFEFLTLRTELDFSDHVRFWNDSG